MTIEITDVLNALNRVIDSTNQHDRAFAHYNGWSWGYHGAAFIFERDQARSDFAQRLNDYIDHRIAIALTEKESN